MKSAIRKLISKKFFTNEPKKEINSFTALNDKYKELSLSKQIQQKMNNKVQEQEELNKMELEFNNENKIDLEPEKANTAVNAEDNQLEKAEANLNSIENINEFEKQNKMLNEIIDDIQDIDNVKNSLDNILENEAQLDLIQDEYVNVNNQKFIVDKKLEENKTNNDTAEEKNVNKQIVSEAEANEGNRKSLNDNINEEFNMKLDNYKDSVNKEKNENTDIDMHMEENIEIVKEDDKRKELEDLKELKDKLLAMEEKFSEYLKQYEKEWDSPLKRIEWV